ncbi:MAG: protein-glutamate O-methyltransferase CheR [Candidatus Cloacimonetes bacterium]|nr:protein-glutamate O-methyltransferase CheR [Candidatus Cloacimonadota bacterium]
MLNTNDLETLEDQCFENFISLIHRLTGITIAKNRKSMVQGRLRKRVQLLASKTYEEYHDYVCGNTDEKKPFIDLITTNETYFFRTPRIWSYLEDQFLPSWIEANPGKVFRAWSAASSTGEEAYSLGILLQQFKMKYPNFDFQISASDISQRVLDICEHGRYQGRSIENFKNSQPLVFNRFMQKNADESFSVHSDVKGRVKFFQHNLFNKLADKKEFDLILIRNVFIYFTSEDQKKVLNLLTPIISKDGTLIIGESETLSGIDDGLMKVENLIYKKKSTNE